MVKHCNLNLLVFLSCVSSFECIGTADAPWRPDLGTPPTMLYYDNNNGWATFFVSSGRDADYDSSSNSELLDDQTYDAHESQTLMFRVEAAAPRILT